MDARRSTPSVIAIIAAIVSFFVEGGWGFLLAVIAIICGVIGFLMAVAPRVKGGLMSIVAIVIGVLGVVVSLLKIVF